MAQVSTSKQQAYEERFRAVGLYEDIPPFTGSSVDVRLSRRVPSVYQGDVLEWFG
jgi:hypothetical protein